MALSKWLGGLSAVFMLSTSAVPAAADPVTVTSGYIQVGVIMSDFVFTTSTGMQVAGDRDSSFPSPALLSGMSGEVVNLSSSFADLVSLTILAPERSDPFARAQWSFTAGTAVVPPLASVIGTDGVLVSAPFSFTGSLFLFATAADAAANTNAIARHDLTGSGTAQSRFRVQTTNTGTPRSDQPLISSSVVYRFADAPAPVPEPGTMLLLLGGLAGTAMKVRGRHSTRTAGDDAH